MLLRRWPGADGLEGGKGTTPLVQVIQAFEKVMDLGVSPKRKGLSYHGKGQGCVTYILPLRKKCLARIQWWGKMPARKCLGIQGGNSGFKWLEVNGPWKEERGRAFHTVWNLFTVGPMSLWSWVVWVICLGVSQDIDAKGKCVKESSRLTQALAKQWIFKSTILERWHAQ